MSSISWPMVLVDSGMEEIEVRREGKIIRHGTEPAGFTMHLTIGDSVWTRSEGGHMKKKWDLRVYKGEPHKKFGKRFGKHNCYEKLGG